MLLGIASGACRIGNGIAMSMDGNPVFKDFSTDKEKECDNEILLRK